MEAERCLSETFIYIKEKSEIIIERNDRDGYVSIKDKTGTFHLLLSPEKYENFKSLILSL